MSASSQAATASIGRGIGPRPSGRRHRARAKPGDHAFPDLGIRVRRRHVDRVEREPGGLQPLVVARDAVGVEHRPRRGRRGERRLARARRGRLDAGQGRATPCAHDERHERGAGVALNPWPWSAAAEGQYTDQLAGHRAKFHDALGPGLGHVDRPVPCHREVVNGVEHRVAGLAEADGRDDLPLAIELQHAGVPRCRSPHAGCPRTAPRRHRRPR